jgi:hypothetical protein
MLDAFKNLDLDALPTDVRAAVLAAQEQASQLASKHVNLTETNVGFCRKFCLTLNEMCI